jgi:small subunit ribosomal protein S6
MIFFENTPCSELIRMIGAKYPRGGLMRRYETIVIAHPSLSQEERQPLFDKLTDLISDPQGLLVKVDEWGQKKLAYEIKKQTRGYYVLMEYCGDGVLVKELERNARLDDRALKYMTVCIGTDVDMDKIKAELEAAQKAAAAATAAAAAAAEQAQDLASSDEGEEVPPEGTSEPTSGETEEADNASQSTVEEEPANGSI